jgi:hypothetical protein
MSPVVMLEFVAAPVKVLRLFPVSKIAGKEAVDPEKAES